MKKILIIITLGSMFVASAGYAQSIRKDYNEMTSDEIDAYVDALYDLRTGDDLIDELRQAHVDHAGSIHSNCINVEERFLPWHRMFIDELEQALQTINSGLSVPYWNWVTDDSPSDPLWDHDFLGQFDSAWSLNRDVGSASSLPTQTQIDNVQIESDFLDYSLDLECVIHNPPHVWIGGVMATMSSPLDPVFFLHHSMVDKLWQEWEEVHQNSSFQNISLPRYTTIDPNDITDSRILNVWYAHDGVVMLNDYETTGTNDYRYTGKIESEDFTVTSGSDVTFTAGEKIVLGSGFKVETGSSFLATVDTGVGNISSQTKEEDASLVDRIDELEINNVPETFLLSQNYPNPFNSATNITYSVPERSHVRIAVYTITGRLVEILVDEVRETGLHTVRFDASRFASGLYVYRMQAGNFVQTRQMTVIK
jgi:tyrosinase